MILQPMNCSHLRRAFDERICFDDDITNPEEYTLVEKAQTFYVHAASQDHLYCIGAHREGQRVGFSLETGGSSQDAYRRVSMFRNRVLNPNSAGSTITQNELTDLRP